MSRGDSAIAAVLRDSRYRIDVVAGVVFGHDGRKLRCPSDRDGYRCFTAVTSIGRMNIRVHRLVAARVWGVEAIRDQQVGHRDGDQMNNSILNLWFPASPKEHNEYDGTVANLTYRTPLKTSWPACVDCGDPDGALKGLRTPARYDGGRFGLDGKLCNKCYQRHCRRDDPKRYNGYARSWRERRVA